MWSVMQNDIKTLAYVLRRTNYAEADRILNLITPTGKMSAIAKSARKAKSKLAGGIEMFSLVELNIHQGKSEMGTITGARMLKYYDRILVSYDRMELAAMILKKISLAAESSDNPDYFKIVDQCLAELNNTTNVALIESWFLLNLAKAMGEDINIYRDTDGEKLTPNERYLWNAYEAAFAKKTTGDFGVDEIKMIKFMMGADLNVSKRVKNVDAMLPKILMLARTFAR